MLCLQSAGLEPRIITGIAPPTALPLSSVGRESVFLLLLVPGLVFFFLGAGALPCLAGSIETEPVAFMTTTSSI
jgi:hypothetical protein